LSSPLVKALVNELLEHAAAHGLTICTAESCSAGALAVAFAQGEGASKHFLGGIVAYTKDAKQNLLGVPAAVLTTNTAVCASVAELMALGAVRRFKADFGVSITGVAGPDPDEDGNPVGLIYCGVARNNGATRHVRIDLASKEPATNVQEACVAALQLLKSFSFS
jgi:nicotinamide-nucleotide amidase